MSSSSAIWLELSVWEETRSCNRVTIFMTLLSIFIADVSHHRPTSVRFSWLLISTAAAILQRNYNRGIVSLQLNFWEAHSLEPNSEIEGMQLTATWSTVIVVYQVEVGIPLRNDLVRYTEYLHGIWMRYWALNDTSSFPFQSKFESVQVPTNNW